MLFFCAISWFPIKCQDNESMNIRALIILQKWLARHDQNIFLFFASSSVLEIEDLSPADGRIAGLNRGMHPVENILHKEWHKHLLLVAITAVLSLPFPGKRFLWIKPQAISKSNTALVCWGLDWTGVFSMFSGAVQEKSCETPSSSSWEIEGGFAAVSPSVVVSNRHKVQAKHCYFKLSPSPFNRKGPIAHKRAVFGNLSKSHYKASLGERLPHSKVISCEQFKNFRHKGSRRFKVKVQRSISHCLD